MLKTKTIKQFFGDTYVSMIYTMLLAVVMSFAFVLTSGYAASAATTKQVSTGDSSACAVVDGWAKCWGANGSGQLGSGDLKNKSTPTAVASNKDSLPAVTHCGASLFGNCINTVVDSPAMPASALAGKYVEKVSVGKTHACALAGAKVYCWGDNSSGQLGNTTTSSTTVPIAVYTQTGYTEHIASYCNGTTLFGRCLGTTVPARDVVHPASALRNKEVVDIATGDNFTCALASDGAVSCWGSGANGRLGTNSTSSVTYPTAIYTGSGSAFAGKKGVKLAKAGSATMCVIAASGSGDTTTGTPYCWGLGVGNGNIPAAKTNKCSSATSQTQGVSTSAVYFDSPVPVNGAGVMAAVKNIDIAGSNRITGVGSNGRAYYWGLRGYIATITVSTPKCTHTETVTSGSNGLDSGGKKCGGGSNHGSPGCGSKTETKVVTNYTEYYTYGYTGSVTTQGPAYNDGSALGGQTLGAVSGNAYDGLFCGVVSAGAYCDAHGTGMANGQTGSGYTQHCTTKTTLGIFKETTCDPDPAGVQKVVTSGWLAGKTINTLNTGNSGFTCALANGSVGCWGTNSSGQLGTGDTTNRNVPTAVAGL